MNAKMGWIGGGLVLFLLAISVRLYSQETEIPIIPQPKETMKEETEESVLAEKVEALEALYKMLGTAVEIGGGGFAAPVDVQIAGCEWQLALAELAALRDRSAEQIRHLERALVFADTAVKFHQKRQEIISIDLVMQSIVKRADVKLALIRAKKKQQSRQ